MCDTRADDLQVAFFFNFCYFGQPPLHHHSTTPATSHQPPHYSLAGIATSPSYSLATITTAHGSSYTKKQRTIRAGFPPLFAFPRGRGSCERSPSRGFWVRLEVRAGLRTRRGKWAEKGGGARVIKRGVHGRFFLLLVWSSLLVLVRPLCRFAPPAAFSSSCRLLFKLPRALQAASLSPSCGRFSLFVESD